MDSASQRATAGQACPEERRVALLVDWDNFSTRCAAQGIAVRPETLKQLGRASEEQLVWSAVFVDSTTLPATERVLLFSSGFTIHDCPKIKVGLSGHMKDTVDPAMIEQMNAVAEFLPVDHVILCSEDRDYLRSVQRLRDAGKRVTVVVPTARDHPDLARYVDDVLVYAEFADAGNSPFSRAAKCFTAGKYGKAQSGEDRDAMLKLVRLVEVLDKDLLINTCHFGFLALLRRTTQVYGRKGYAVAEDEIKRMLEFLIAQHVLVTKSTRGKHPARKAGTRKNGSAPIHYRIDRTHSFAIWVECGGFDTAGNCTAGASVSDDRSRTVDESHPRIKRFREKYAHADPRNVGGTKERPAEKSFSSTR